MSSLFFLDVGIFVVGAVASFLVGANNTATSLGILVSTRALSPKKSFLYTALVSFLGTVINSKSLENSVKNLIQSDYKIYVSLAVLTIVSASSVAFYLLNKSGIPSSLSQMVYISAASLFLVSQNEFSIDWVKFYVTAISWLVSPLSAIVLSLIIFRSLKYISTTNSLVIQMRFHRTFVLIASLINAYVVGANAIGVLVSVGLVGINDYYLVATVYGISSAIGIYVSSLKPSIVVGFRIAKLGYLGASSALISGGILSEVFTLLGIPISITQTILGGIIGLSLRNLSRDVIKQLIQVTKGWLTSPVISAVASLAIYGVLKSLLGL
ncbi:MAG: inorganic phosphate transporter [Sulfolobaceae archaeon]|nr:inorganic phosphate transporter [Sulfolobales archaeon]